MNVYAMHIRVCTYQWCGRQAYVVAWARVRVGKMRRKCAETRRKKKWWTIILVPSHFTGSFNLCWNIHSLGWFEFRTESHTENTNTHTQCTNRVVTCISFALYNEVQNANLVPTTCHQCKGGIDVDTDCGCCGCWSWRQTRLFHFLRTPSLEPTKK